MVVRRLSLAGKPREDFRESIKHSKSTLDKVKSSISRQLEAPPSSTATGGAAADDGSGSGAGGATSPERDLVTGMLQEIMTTSCAAIGELLDTVLELLPTAPGASSSSAPAVGQTPRHGGGWLGLTQGAKK
jgi:hypothetical protein